MQEQEKEIWTILKVLKWTAEYFSDKNIDSARLDAELLLCKVLGCERMYLYVHYDQPLTVQELKDYRVLILQRAKNMPVAYILEKKDFLDFTVKVTPAVLIPRPETELLVENILLAYPEDTTLSVLDLCCGSGIIGIALARARSLWQVTMSDISPEAIAVAKENVCRLAGDKQLKVICSDIFASLPKERYDLIVTNPPYINPTDKASLSADVLNEPHLALFAADEGLAFYKEIAKSAKDYLSNDGCVAMEFGIGQRMAIEDIFTKAGFKNLKVYKDYAGIERMLFAGY